MNTSTADPTTWRRSPILWVAALILAAMALTLILTSNDDSVSGQETAAVSISGVGLPPFDQPDLALGETAPELVGTSIGGQELAVSHGSSAKVYGFFAHWCGHCRAELPRLSAWLDSNDLPEDVELVAVSTAVEEAAENYPPSDWFDREGYPGPVLADDSSGSAAQAFGLTGFPYWVVTAPDGTVVARLSGELTESEFESLIALAERTL